MEEATVSIRELRLNFGAVRKKMARHGELVITDNGEPLYRITQASAKKIVPKTPPDYWARLSKRKSKPLNAEQTRSLHEENRGDR